MKLEILNRQLAIEILIILSSVLCHGCPGKCVCHKQYNTADCTRNSLTTLPKNLPTFVYELRLEDNFIKNVGPRPFTKGIKLSHLDLSRNQIYSINPDAFDQVRNSLLFLNLGSNRLKRIPSKATIQLGYLKTFDLSGNHIDQIDTRSFDKMNRLTKLDLSHNAIEHISADAFSGAFNLEVLKLQKNKIKSISHNTLAHLSALIDLDISNNDIEVIHSSSFFHVSYLKKLILGSNFIESIEDGTLSGMRTLVKLDLSNNSLISIDSGTFNNLMNLQELCLNSNNITSIEPNSFSDLKRLKLLDLSENRLKTLPLGYSEHLQNLLRLNLSGNSLEKFVDGTFDSNIQGLSTLTMLDLSRNKITSTNPRQFSSLHSLRNLNLSSNQLTAVDGSSFQENENLVSLNLQGNMLKTPNFSWIETAVDQFMGNNSKIIILLQNNPWTCNCEVIKFTKAILDLNEDSVDVESIGLVCEEPNYLKGRSHIWVTNFHVLSCLNTLQLIINYVFVALLISLILYYVLKFSTILDNFHFKYKLHGRLHLISNQHDKVL